MAREVYVNLGGQERRLMFDAARAAMEIEKRLGKRPIHVADKDLLPKEEDASFSVTALTFVLWLGLRHGDRRLTEDQVTQWVSDVFVSNGELGGFRLCALARDALLLSGACGWSYDQQAQKDEEAEGQDGAGDQGKAAAVRPAEEP